MAKSTNVTTQAKKTYDFKSRFGSHSDMIIKENEDGTLVLKDEFGEYTTSKSYIDANMADPNRFDLVHRNVSLS